MINPLAAWVVDPPLPGDYASVYSNEYDSDYEH